jgi:cytochrome c-type biogenesis protein CcmH/NrfG
VSGDGPATALGWLNRARLSEQGRRHYGALLDDLTRWWLPRDPVQAAAAGRTATLIHPEGAILWLNLGQALLRAGDMEGAIESTREALTLAPQNPKARLNFARLSLTQEPRRVAALLDPVIEADPRNAAALGVRGVARARTGDLNGAAADWERALAIDPRQPEARAGMAQLKAMRQ